MCGKLSRNAKGTNPWLMCVVGFRPWNFWNHFCCSLLHIFINILKYPHWSTNPLPKWILPTHFDNMQLRKWIETPPCLTVRIVLAFWHAIFGFFALPWCGHRIEYTYFLFCHSKLPCPKIRYPCLYALWQTQLWQFYSFCWQMRFSDHSFIISVLRVLLNIFCQIFYWFLYLTIPYFRI